MKEYEELTEEQKAVYDKVYNEDRSEAEKITLDDLNGGEGHEGVVKKILHEDTMASITINLRLDGTFSSSFITGPALGRIKAVEAATGDMPDEYFKNRIQLAALRVARNVVANPRAYGAALPNLVMREAFGDGDDCDCLPCRLRRAAMRKVAAEEAEA